MKGTKVETVEMTSSLSLLVFELAIEKLMVLSDCSHSATEIYDPSRKQYSVRLPENNIYSTFDADVSKYPAETYCSSKATSSNKKEQSQETTVKHEI